MAFGAVFGGAAIEGVHISALIQPTAAMIVLGGTFGATFVCFPLAGDHWRTEKHQDRISSGKS